MSALLAPRLLLLLGECLAASALLPLLALAAAACFPRRAAMRHLVWLALFASLLTLPLAAMLVPSRFLIAQPAATAVAMTDIVPAVTMTDAAPQSQSVMVSAATPAPRAFDSSLLLRAGLMLWLAGVLFLLLHRALALLGLRRLRRASVAHELPEVEAGCDVRLAARPGAHGPMTWGILRPVILLPREALSWPRERLALVLRHEFAHVARHDTLTQTLAQLACALYWPNMLVWLAARRLRREAEIAADDVVLAAGIKPSSYAEALLALAAEFRGANIALAMAAPSALAARVTSVLSPNPSRTGATSMDAFKIASLSVCALALMALARPDLAVAQNAAPVAPAAPAIAAQPPAPPVTPVHPAPATPPSETRAGPVPASRLEAAAVRARLEAQAAAIKAQSDAIKAKGDALAAQAQQKAEADKDQANRAKDLADAAKIRAQADVVKAQADRLAARAMTFAANTPPSSHEATAEAESSATNDFTINSQKVATVQRFQKDHIRIEALIDSTMTEAMMKVRPELQDAIHATVMQSLREASEKINAAIAQAQAQAKPAP